MINPRLYGVLKHLYNEVRIQDEGMAPRLTYDQQTRRIKVLDRGEHYYLNCPICGEDKGRLAIGSSWLTRHEGRLVTTGARCFNDGCEVYKPEFYSRILRLIESPKALELEKPYRSLENKPPRPERVWRLPNGFQLLDQLADDHPAVTFLRAKYNGLTPTYLAQAYGVGYTDQYDPEFRLSAGRIIFPVYTGGKLVGWQGRTIRPTEKVRWYLPSGFSKDRAMYNLERVTQHQIPVICEGIATAISAGPSGLAIYGVSLSENQCRLLGQRFRTAIIGLDPETQVLDLRMKNPIRQAHELKRRLDPFLSMPSQLFPYPAEVLALAERKVRREEVKVPDLADFGPLATRQMIAQLPYPWSSLAVL